MSSVKYPCRNCIYFAQCGNTNRTQPCNGRKTKKIHKTITALLLTISMVVPYSQAVYADPVEIADLNAQWIANSVKITFNSNGGGTAPGEQVYVYGVERSLPGQCQMLKPGYTFLGWSESSSATTPDFRAGDCSFTAFGFSNVNSKVAKTLYAVWKQGSETSSSSDIDLSKVKVVGSNVDANSIYTCPVSGRLVGIWIRGYTNYGVSAALSRVNANLFLNNSSKNVINCQNNYTASAEWGLIYKDYIIDNSTILKPASAALFTKTTNATLGPGILNTNGLVSCNTSHSGSICNIIIIPIPFTELRVSFTNSNATSTAINVDNQVYIAYIPDED